MPVQFIQGHNTRVNRRGYLVDESTGCWIYQGHIGPHGYGGIQVEGVRYRAHRWYYLQTKGQIPPGFQVDHLCRNTRCVNPDHLEAVPPAINVRRSSTAKLTEALVDEIRQKARSGLMCSVIAREFGVSFKCVMAMLRGRSWKAVAS